MSKLSSLIAGLQILERHYLPDNRPGIGGGKSGSFFEIVPTDTPLSMEEYDTMVSLGWEQGPYIDGAEGYNPSVDWYIWL